MATGDILKDSADTYGTSFGGSQSTFVCNWSSGTAAAGSLLVAIAGVTNYQYGGYDFSAASNGSGLSTPNAWNESILYSGNLFSIVAYWREAEGGETGVTITPSSGGVTGWGHLCEIDSTDLDLSALDASTTNFGSAGTQATSIGSGTASGTATTGLAIAVFGHDSGPSSLDTSTSYTNSFTRFIRSYVDVNMVGLHAAKRTISSNSNSTTFSSSLNDYAVGGMLVWGGSSAPVLSLDSVTGTVTYGGTFTANLTAGGSSGSASITQGSHSDTLTINSWGATSASLSLPAITSSHLVPGSATLSMTNAASQNDTLSVTVAAPTGYSSVTLTSVSSTGLIPTSTALGTGDVIIYTSALGADFVVNANGTYSVDGAVANGTYTATLRVWDASDGNWGSSETLTIIISEGEYPLVVGNMSLSLTLNDVALRYSGSDRTLPVSTMELSLATSNVGLVKASSLSVGNLGLTLALQDVNLSYAPITKTIVVNTMSLALSLKSVGLIYSNAATSSNYVFVKPLTKNIARSLHGHF